MKPFIWNWGSYSDLQQQIIRLSKVHEVPPATQATLGGLLLRAHRIMLEGGLSLPQPVLKYREKDEPGRRALVGPYWNWDYLNGSVELAAGGSSAYGPRTIQIVMTGRGRVEDPSDSQIWQNFSVLAAQLEEAPRP